MALPATDAFTAANGTALQTYNASWTINTGAFDIQSNSVHSNSAGVLCMAHWNADTFSDNQYSQIKVLGTVGSWKFGVSVRVASSATTAYSLLGDSAAIYLYRYLGGVSASLGSVSYTVLVNDIALLEVVGTRLTAKINGVTKITATDSNITSGSAGLWGMSNGVDTRADDWEGGNMPSITMTHQALRTAKHQRRQR